MRLKTNEVCLCVHSHNEVLPDASSKRRGELGAQRLLLLTMYALLSLLPTRHKHSDGGNVIELHIYARARNGLRLRAAPNSKGVRCCYIRRVRVSRAHDCWQRASAPRQSINKNRGSEATCTIATHKRTRTRQTQSHTEISPQRECCLSLGVRIKHAHTNKPNAPSSTLSQRESSRVCCAYSHVGCRVSVSAWKYIFRPYLPSSNVTPGTFSPPGTAKPPPSPSPSPPMLAARERRGATASSARCGATARSARGT